MSVLVGQGRVVGSAGFPLWGFMSSGFVLTGL